jgi:hypothetical protein
VLRRGEQGRSALKRAECRSWREQAHAAEPIPGGERSWISAAVRRSMTFIGPPVNIFTAPGKAMVGERPKPGEPLGFDPITSTLIFGEHDAVLVDAMGTVAEAEALADWVALHNRNLQTIYITHGHFDQLLRSERSPRPFPRRSGDSNVEDGGGHAVVVCSSAEPIRPPIVSWASADEVGLT